MKAITEGKTKLIVHTGKISKKLPVFFNPDKEFDRSVSVIFIKSLNRSLKMLDLLAASGARGIRILKETKNIEELNLNDMNSLAVKEIKKNLKMNKLKAEVTNLDSREYLATTSKYFDYIDVDPFGSPNPFLELSISKLRNNGILSITATDCGALYGTYPKAGLRKYHSYTFKTNYSHEVGLRILVKHAIMKSAEQEVALTPILVHQTRHYFRAYFRAERGAKKCDALIKQIKFLSHCNSCLRREIADIPKLKCDCGKDMKILGPLFAGKLQDKNLLKEMRKINKDKRIEKLLNTLISELDTIGFYDISKLSSKLKISVPKIDKLFKALEKNGFKASRTHITGEGFKTDADYNSITEAMK